ncbi:MAG: dipicolinate synthase subunit B [Clostridia bacterium]|nr:dipicolinate synthase subunit B [Clostridia bacterium]
MNGGIRLGFAICGSFCTFKRVIPVIERLVCDGFDVYPIMSFTAYNTDTRFGAAEDFIAQIESITGKKIIHSIRDAEPIGPKKMLDIIVVAPCTGNTLAKLSLGIADTPVTLAVKAHLRNNRPVVIAVSTNDALSGNAKSIGALMNMKNISFVPFVQDDSEEKPSSLVAVMEKIPETVVSALSGKQIQPLLDNDT